MAVPQEQYESLLAELSFLKKENEEMKALLREHGLSYHPATKAVLFRGLFRGREDVFARRWYSKASGKGGYQPVCVNEWRRGVCDKKKFKCAECPNRQFAALAYQDIYRHLEGRDENACDVVGLYALIQDNSCAFLCTDFDDKSCEHGYKSDVLAFVGVCKDWGTRF